MPKKKNASGANEPSKWRSKIVGHEKVQAGQLMANPFNHRRHPEKQRKVVAASINELGFIKSVIVNKVTGHIVDGHERVMQALGVGEETLVDVEYVELSPEDEKKALLVLDASSELAEVDASSLDQLVKDCAFDMGVLDDLAKEMLADFPMVDDEPKITEDDIPEPPVDPITKLGDLWILGEHRLLCGDSTKTEDVGRLMAGAKAGSVVTDPPYGVSYVGKTKDALPVHNDGKETLLPLLKKSLGLAFSTSEAGAVWYVAAPPGPQFYDFATVLLELEVWRQTIVWAKQSLVMGHSDYHYQHEAIFYGWTPGAAHQAPPDRKQTTLWHYDRPTASREHPTMKPVALFAKMLDNSTNKQTIVYEPFCGSGTTLIAAEQLGRKCYGMEISPQYCDVIVKRWENLTGKKAVLETVKS